MQQHHDPELVALDNELLDLLSGQIKVLEDAAPTQINANPQMPELGTIDVKQIATLAGVASINNDSGRTEGKRSISGGKSNVSCLLYQAVLVASTHKQHRKFPCGKKPALECKLKYRP